jgi:hypothetical protein
MGGCMKKTKMLFLAGVLAVMAFGYSQAQADGLALYCDTICVSPGSCSLATCYCPKGSPGEGNTATCHDYRIFNVCEDGAHGCIDD